VAPWCSVDLSSGNLTVVLEPFNCFDAEVYADELDLDEPIEFRDDQRGRRRALFGKLHVHAD
jgi:WD repeat-containing protein 48